MLDCRRLDHLTVGFLVALQTPFEVPFLLILGPPVEIFVTDKHSCDGLILGNLHDTATDACLFLLFEVGDARDFTLLFDVFSCLLTLLHLGPKLNSCAEENRRHEVVYTAIEILFSFFFLLILLTLN